ncbi:hypothetical protein EVAR_9257_1 [Eumeta japonica]|uniref:Uncharacterized protein n=1 Tax=Eumeta variegata TaxID=151549 RepID=A0A4C1TLS7_EUMVA|nr:hypothetical protein EVAR_9257_1 [Eumeta japonica]
MEDPSKPSDGDNKSQAASSSRISPSDDTPVEGHEPCPASGLQATARRVNTVTGPVRADYEENGIRRITTQWEYYGHPSHPTPSTYASIKKRPPHVSLECPLLPPQQQISPLHPPPRKHRYINRSCWTVSQSGWCISRNSPGTLVTRERRAFHGSLGERAVSYGCVGGGSGDQLVRLSHAPKSELPSSEGSGPRAVGRYSPRHCTGAVRVRICG